MTKFHGPIRGQIDTVFWQIDGIYKTNSAKANKYISAPFAKYKMMRNSVIINLYYKNKI